MKRLHRLIRLVLREKWSFPPIWIVWVNNRVALKPTYPMRGQLMFAINRWDANHKAQRLFERMNGYRYGGGKGNVAHGYAPMKCRQLGLWIIEPILNGWQPELRFIK